MPALSKNNFAVVAFSLFVTLLPLHAWADTVALSSLSLSSYQRSGTDLVINTTGTAKIKLSFDQPQIVRVQVSPTGVFDEKPSFAVIAQKWPTVPFTTKEVAGVLIVRSSDIVVHINASALAIAVYGEGGKALLTGDSLTGGVRWDPETGAVDQATALMGDERVYGLGQDNRNDGTLNRRGNIYDLVTGQQINSGNVTADDPVPFYLSTGRNGHGYGVFINSVWRLRVDVGKTDSNVLDWSAAGGPIDYFVFDGPSFKSVITNYTQLTGRPPMLPLWAFGYWQSKCAYQNFPEMQGIADNLRKDGIPVDAMVIDYSWPAHFQDFKWGSSWLADGKTPAQSLADMRADHLHVVQSNSGPMIRQDSPNYASGWADGVFATDGNGNPVTCGYYGGELLDFTNPKLPSWLWPQLKPLWQQGINGWWLDLIEPENEPSNTVYYAGTVPSVHNTFSTRVIGTYYNFQKSVAPDSRPVMLARAGAAGEQRYGAVLWSGDTNSDWPTFRAEIPEAQNSGLSGLSWWTNDSGGFLSGFYKDDQYGAHARLYTRWLEFSSFAPVARAHKAGPSAPLDYGPIAIAAAKKYLGLRYRLLPYIYTYAHVTSATGLPLLRPLVLEYQNDPLAGDTKDEFLLGSDLLVAPVVEEDAVSRDVYLPHGTWIGLENGVRYAGGTTVTVDAPIDTIPLFVRAGAIIPLAPAMLSTGEKPWDPITLDVYPHLDSSFTLVQDDGLTTAFEHGVLTATTIQSHEVPGKSETLSIAESNRLFSPKKWIAEIHLAAAPKSVTVDSKAATGWSYDSALGVVDIPVANGDSLTHVVTVSL